MDWCLGDRFSLYCYIVRRVFVRVRGDGFGVMGWVSGGYGGRL